MNCVDYAINEIMNSDIPNYILKLAFGNVNSSFMNNYYNTNNDYGVEQNIRNKVIYRTVLPRCSVQGGLMEYIDLTSAAMTDLGQGNLLVQVPSYITGGRKIISVVEVYQGSINATTGVLGVLDGNEMSSCGVGTLNLAQKELLNTLRPNNQYPLTYTRIQPQGNNSFVICGLPKGVLSMTAKVILESDNALSHIDPKAFPYFAALCLYAVKTFIYRECLVPTNEAVAMSGVSMDIIQSSISGYADSYANYNDYFQNTWLEYMGYSDRIRKYGNIQMAVSGR